MDGQVVTNSAATVAQYGILGIACVIFAIVIKMLYSENRADRNTADAERKLWNEERQKMRAENVSCTEQCRTEKETLAKDYERRHREVLEGYATQLRQVKSDSEEFVEKISNGAKASNDALIAMLQKFYEKIVK